MQISRFNHSLSSNLLRQNIQSVTGILNPIEWDSKGVSTKFSIYSDDEEDILLEGPITRKKIEGLVNKRVVATGSVRLNEYGEKLMRVERIEKQNGPNSCALQLPKNDLLQFWGEEYSVEVPLENILNDQYGDSPETFWDVGQ